MALSISSRYYEIFEMLRLQLKDSSIENLKVLVEDFKCNIASNDICANILNRIHKFMQTNLFSKDETVLLIQNLIPHLGIIGGHSVGIAKSRIELIDKLGKRKENQCLIHEYEKLISTIGEIQLTIKQHLTDKYLTSTITGFKNSLSELQQKELHKALNCNYIECTEADYLAAFSGDVLPNAYENILWKKSEPLFCCLIYGYDIVLKSGISLSFQGIGEQSEYKKAIQLFSFKTKTTNKTLSSTIQKITTATKIDGLQKLDSLIKAVL